MRRVNRGLGEEITEVKSKIGAEKYEDINDIMDMLVQNLSKIVEHGQRADSIVKGMLMHSREKVVNLPRLI